MSPCLRELCQVLMLASLITYSAAAVAITGSVFLDPSLKSPSLQVWVQSRYGALVESSPVASDGSVLFHSLPTQTDGVYVLHLNGATSYEYLPILVLLQNGAITSAMPRTEPLMIPPDAGAPAWPSTTEIEFKPFGKTNYAKKSPPWRLRDLWRNKIRLLQLLALVFVVWFPQFIRELPKELREELMGEKEEDMGDPNALVKTLLGRANSIPSTTSERN